MSIVKAMTVSAPVLLKVALGRGEVDFPIHGAWILTDATLLDVREWDLRRRLVVRNLVLDHDGEVSLACNDLLELLCLSLEDLFSLALSEHRHNDGGAHLLHQLACHHLHLTNRLVNLVLFKEGLEKVSVARSGVKLRNGKVLGDDDLLSCGQGALIHVDLLLLIGLLVGLLLVDLFSILLAILLAALVLRSLLLRSLGKAVNATPPVQLLLVLGELLEPVWVLNLLGDLGLAASYSLVVLLDKGKRLTSLCGLLLLLGDLLLFFEVLLLSLEAELIDVAVLCASPLELGFLGGGLHTVQAQKGQHEATHLRLSLLVQSANLLDEGCSALVGVILSLCLTLENLELVALESAQVARGAGLGTTSHVVARLNLALVRLDASHFSLARSLALLGLEETALDALVVGLVRKNVSLLLLQSTEADVEAGSITDSVHHVFVSVESATSKGVGTTVGLLQHLVVIAALASKLLL